MVIQCDSCNAKFRLDDSKIGPKGAKVKCTKCANVFKVMPGGIAPPVEPPPAPIDGGLGISFDEGDDATPPMPPVTAAPPPVEETPAPPDESGPAPVIPPPVKTPQPPVEEAPVAPPIPPVQTAPVPPVEEAPVAPPIPPVQTAPVPPVEEAPVVPPIPPVQEAPALPPIEEAPVAPPIPPVQEAPTPPVEEAPSTDSSGYFTGDDGNLSIGGDLADSDDFSGEAPGVDGGIDFGMGTPEPPEPPSDEGVAENIEGDGGYYDADADFVDHSETNDFAIDFGTTEEDESDEGISFGFDTESEGEDNGPEDHSETVVFSIGSDNEATPEEEEEEKTVFGYTPPSSAGEDETIADGSQGAMDDEDDDGDIVFTGPPPTKKELAAAKVEAASAEDAVSETGQGITGEDSGGLGEVAFSPTEVEEPKAKKKSLSMPKLPSLSFNFERFKKPVLTVLVLGLLGGGGYYFYPAYQPYIEEYTGDMEMPDLTEIGMPDMPDMAEINVIVGDIIQILPPEVLGVMGKTKGTPNTDIVVVTKVSGAFTKNDKLGTVFVLRGTIKNKTKKHLTLKGARGILYNAKGKIIASNSTEPGRDLTADEIKKNSESDFIRSLGRNKGAKIPPGSVMPVLVVFTEFPKGLSEASIEISF